MNEAQTRLNLIAPVIRAAGWTVENDCQALVEQRVAPGRVGKVRGKTLRADMFTRDDALAQLIVTKYHALPDARRILGDLRLISTGFATLQRAVYAA